LVKDCLVWDGALECYPDSLSIGLSGFPKTFSVAEVVEVFIFGHFFAGANMNHSKHRIPSILTAIESGSWKALPSESHVPILS